MGFLLNGSDRNWLTRRIPTEAPHLACFFLPVIAVVYSIDKNMHVGRRFLLCSEYFKFSRN